MFLFLSYLIISDQYQEAQEIISKLNCVSASISKSQNQTNENLEKVIKIKKLIQQTELEKNWTKIKNEIDRLSNSTTSDDKNQLEIARNMLKRNIVESNLLSIRSKYQKKRISFFNLLKSLIFSKQKLEFGERIKQNKYKQWEIKGDEAIFIFKTKENEKITNFSISKYLKKRSNMTISFEFYLNNKLYLKTDDFHINGSATQEQFYVLNNTAICNFIKAHVKSIEDNIYMPQINFYDDVTVNNNK